MSSHFPYGPADRWSAEERERLFAAVQLACPYTVEAALVVGSSAMGRPGAADVDLVVSVPASELQIEGLWRYAYFPLGDRLTREFGRRFDTAYTNGLAAAWQTDAAGRLLPALDVETGRLIGRGAGPDNAPRWSVIGHHTRSGSAWRHVYRKPTPPPSPPTVWA